MSTLLSAAQADQAFAVDVLEGLRRPGQKQLPSMYFYDELGSALFEAITVLPEYGLTRADTQLLRLHAHEIIGSAPADPLVIELGSGSGKKTRPLLEALGKPRYFPVDVSRAALELCASQLGDVADVRPIEGAYLDGVRRAALERRGDQPLLVLFLGSTIGNFDRAQAVRFLADLRGCLRFGDALLIGVDLVKAVDAMITAYDDPAGVTAAFNLNLLGRMNRELGANFDLRRFRHEARWNALEYRIEMHLCSTEAHWVSIPAAEADVWFDEGETIWTESSHKYTPAAVAKLADEAAWSPVAEWLDGKWGFAECLWTYQI